MSTHKAMVKHIVLDEFQGNSYVRNEEGKEEKEEKRCI